MTTTTTTALFQNLDELLDDVVSRAPARPAIVTDDKQLSYRDLQRHITELADVMREHVQPGERVALLLPNGCEFAIATWALFSIGAIPVPLHIKYLEREIARYLRDCEISTVVADQRMLRALPALVDGGPPLAQIYSTEPGRIGLHPTLDLPSRSPRSRFVPTLSTPALSQYSTGSTGVSKRVTRLQGQILGETLSVSGAVGISPDDRILGVAPMFHSYGFVNVMMCGLASAATLYLMEEFFPRETIRIIETHRITGFPGVPFMYELLADFAGDADLSSLRYCLSAGSPLPVRTATSFQRRFGLPIQQLYGSTETGVVAFDRPADVDASTSSVGRPIPGVTVEIVDDAGQPVEEERVGNVTIRSLFAATSYDRVAAHTESTFQAERFFPGDIGRILRDGRVQLAGRKRMFINVAGNKVDPTEVEGALREHPLVSDVAVVGVPAGAGGETVKAVLVTSAPCNRADLFEHCRRRLAEYKRPRIIEFRDEIPKSPIGKVLCKYLVEEAETPRSANDASAAPAFDALNGFRADSPGGPATATAVTDLSGLSPLLRALLVTDGTVTKLLEAYLWEPICVERLSQCQVSTEHPIPALGLPAGHPVLQRRVVLRGGESHRALVFADSVIATRSLADDLQEDLLQGRLGIGELLRERRLETYRELVDVQRSSAGEYAGALELDPQAPVLIRRYRIFADRRPAILITEVFPEQRFQAMAHA